MFHNDKYKAVWVSHSSIGDFLKCPRLYYLSNIYKDPITNHKINVINPAMALGQVVHNVLEALSVLSVETRFEASLLESYDKNWEQVAGQLGGFKDEAQEVEYKARGAKMLRLVMEHPGPLLKKAVKINQDLPHYWFSEDDNIILCGKIDWLEYIEEDDSVHVIDFKTGRSEEKEDSLQLPIYHLLVKNCQNRNVSKVSYWYIETETGPTVMALPDLAESHERVMAVAKDIEQTRENQAFACPRGGCFACEPYEAIINSQAKFVGVGTYNQDLYILP